jgi:hypothetical protein
VIGALVAPVSIARASQSEAASNGAAQTHASGTEIARNEAIHTPGHNPGTLDHAPHGHASESKAAHRKPAEAVDHDHSDRHGAEEERRSLAVSVAKYSPLNTDASKEFSVACGDGRKPAGCNFAFFLGKEPTCRPDDKSKLIVNRVAATTGAVKGCLVEAAAPPSFSAACPWRIGVQAVCIEEHAH